MSKPTWGLYIPGYSYPSVAQQRYFKKLYPEVVAWHNHSLEEERIKEEERLHRLKKKSEEGNHSC